ncbi:Protein of unknown function [Bacillus cytotoxicus]
MGIV